MNPLMRLVLGPGRFSDELRAELLMQNPLVLREGLPGSLTFRNYRAPGRRSSWRKEAATGAIAVTARRLVVWIGRHKHIDVPLADSWRDAIEVGLEPPDRLCLAYDAGRLDPSRSGRVEIRLRTPDAPHIADLLRTSSTP